MSRFEGRAIGLDLGSTAAKMVVLVDGRIVEKKTVPSHRWRELAGAASGSERVFTTGYFRTSMEAEASCTEITAAKHGAAYLLGTDTVDVLVDIGGQDTKVIDVRGTDFRLNDKCSAGTGAFLEFMAHYLGVEVEQLGSLHQKAEGRRVRVNSTCSVFALSEVVTHLVEGNDLEAVIAGVHHAFAAKIARMVPESASTVGLFGGPALNSGVVDALAQELSARVVVVEPPQLVNAVGAIVYGTR